jgi:hypothetical protein
MVIKYRFSDETTPSQPKKRKQDESSLNNIINYSHIKLPAKEMIKYLNEHSLSFINECLK